MTSTLSRHSPQKRKGRQQEQNRKKKEVVCLAPRPKEGVFPSLHIPYQTENRKEGTRKNLTLPRGEKFFSFPIYPTKRGKQKEKTEKKEIFPCNLIHGGTQVEAKKFFFFPTYPTRKKPGRKQWAQSVFFLGTPTPFKSRYLYIHSRYFYRSCLLSNRLITYNLTVIAS